MRISNVFSAVAAATWFLALGIAAHTAKAQEGGSSAEEMARALQDPLATLAALMTDNSINFGMGDDDDVGYEFQLQPVYAVPAPEWGVNFIPRAVIPIVGAPPGSDFPKLGEQRSSGGSTTWGLSDIQAQLFVSPRTEGNWKWGAGPQVSFRTRTDTKVAGPGWGGGPVGIIVGSEGPWSFAGIFGNVWGQDDFNVGFVQPMIFYNFESLPGFSLSYNNTIAADWSASSDDRWTVPLGLTANQTFDMGDGYGLDLGLGAYGLAVKPDGGADWQLKFAITVLFPR